MGIEQKKEVLTELEDQMNAAGFLTRVETIEDMEMLRVIMDELGDDEKGSVLMELCFLPLEGEGIPEDLSLFQIFTTIEKDIPRERLGNILDRLNKINLDCMLGGFHIFEEQMQLYHKYICIVRGSGMEDMMLSIQPAINWIVSTVQESYEELTGVCRE